MISRKSIEKELALLRRKVEAAWKKHEKDPDHGNKSFICPGVGVVGTCTSTSVYLASRLGGDVYGYSIEDNPDATVGAAEFGHDFTLIGDRYLVDFWARDTYQHRDLYDLWDPEDRDLVRKMYGDRRKWRKMGPENFAHWKRDLASYV